MDQTTSTAAATTTCAHPVDLEALRLRLKEDGNVYFHNQNSKEARERLLHMLQTNDCREIITTIVNKDDLADVFVIAGCKGHLDILEAFVDHGMNIDIKDKNGETALMNASYYDHEECVRLLLDNNASVNARNEDGWTALMAASVNRHISIVEMLLEKNANPDLQDNDGWTVLMFASQSSHKEIVQVLLDHNADIELRNNNGKTALDLAKTEEIKEMIRNHVNTSYVLK